DLLRPLLSGKRNGLADHVSFLLALGRLEPFRAPIVTGLIVPTSRPSAELIQLGHRSGKAGSDLIRQPSILFRSHEGRPDRDWIVLVDVDIELAGLKRGHLARAWVAEHVARELPTSHPEAQPVREVAPETLGTEGFQRTV